MEKKIDWQAAKAAMLEVASRYFGEIPRDRKVRCPFHDDGTASLHVYDDKWHCYGCGAHGDAVDLIAKMEGISTIEAVKRMDGQWIDGPVVRSEKIAEWVEADTVPTDTVYHPKLGSPEAMYPYHRGDRLIGYICRWELPGGKIIRPVTACRHEETGEVAWRWQAFANPRPLYRSDAHKGTLILVEGEKVADYLRGYGLPGCTWAGGAGAWKHSDWQSLQADRVVLWPDADEPGRIAMIGIAEILSERGIMTRMVDTSDLDDRMDAADLTEPDIRARIVKAIKSPEPVKAEPEPVAHQWPFRCLGYRLNRYYFIEHRGQQIVDYSARELSSSANLLVLAPLEWWDANFRGRSAVDWTSANNALIQECLAAGFYGPHRERGRGIWRDEGRIIYHRGSEAVVDGVPSRLVAVRSKFAYAIGDELPGPDARPLTADEARRLVLEGAAMFSWKNQAYGPLLAGWVATAMVCGALSWRPHVWLTGAAGSGKTTIMNQFIASLLGGMALLAQGASSEAGIRQALGSDARPVIFDESESQSESESKRIASVLATIRQASSETASQVYKGTASAKAVTYHIRSSFCLGSIQVGMSQQADRERITRLVLQSAKAGDMTHSEAEARYKAWLDHRAAWPDDISRRLLARMIGMVPVLLETVSAMVDALGPHVAGRREADQLGALMAGAWCLQSDDVPTPDEAAQWVSYYDWVSVLDGASETDAERARAALLGIITHGEERATIADRIAWVMGGHVDTAEHQRVLGWFGLRVIDGRLFVSHTNENRTGALRQTSYAADLTGLLKQLPGTVAHQARVNGATVKGVLIETPA